VPTACAQPVRWLLLHANMAMFALAARSVVPICAGGARSSSSITTPGGSSAAALPPPPPPDLTCRDTSRPKVCQAARLSNCTVTHTRAGCANSCGLCSALVVPVHVATLIDGRLPIPQAVDKVFVEVGSSDRNTLDLELLPDHADAFLVSCEPLIDKYARAISRRAPQKQVFDQHEPLGQHHSRGIILPIAIAPSRAASARASATRFDSGGTTRLKIAPLSGGAQTLKVSGAAGCSSLMDVHQGRRRQRANHSFGSWCDRIAEERRVWSEPLEQVLRWIDRPVDFVKIDAQGMDLEVVRSGGARLQSVHRISMEVR